MQTLEQAIEAALIADGRAALMSKEQRIAAVLAVADAVSGYAAEPEPTPLQDCPFGCLQADSWPVHRSEDGGAHQWVECSNGCHGPVSSTKEGAVLGWNSRGRTDV